MKQILIKDYLIGLTFWASTAILLSGFIWIMIQIWTDMRVI